MLSCRHSKCGILCLCKKECVLQIKICGGDIVKEINIKKISKRYTVRKLNLDDVQMIYTFCKKNTQYYEYCGKELSIELIKKDIEITPPGIPIEQKYYIGFFMMDCGLQGNGIGSKIVSESLEYLSEQGFQKCQLGIDKDNPQSNHFWRKNGFEVIREVEIEEGIILAAEKPL